ncbi:MAG TPA: L-histidine N(alpha)-methyltransferase, partial [Gemmatales bacterium]|nr:L-histidine N(alpha)-methyltransferase [Gemmatales bacterium]
MREILAAPRRPSTLFQSQDRDFQADVLAGLRARPKSLPCKYFYDAAGSQLFERICELPEYYPTRTELAILEQHGAELAKWIGSEALLIELGSGSSTKTRLLLRRRGDWAGYVPVDVSREHLVASAARLREEFLGLPVQPCFADISRPLLPRPSWPAGRRVLFFPGSTIGNFSATAALTMLRQWRRLVGTEGGLILGVDLVKETNVLEAAYNDAAGVTAAFNQNLLVRINRTLRANLPVGAFRHEAIYDVPAQRIEMRLVCERDLWSYLSGWPIRFEAGERIVTEHSHKYNRADIESLLAESGWQLDHWWTDPRTWFAVLAA